MKFYVLKLFNPRLIYTISKKQLTLSEIRQCPNYLILLAIDIWDEKL
jgi:hypothetical protein